MWLEMEKKEEEVKNTLDQLCVALTGGYEYNATIP